ncbi:MAG: hypothetical protein ACRCV9_09695 [Burkholderiaceae bacterium]
MPNVNLVQRLMQGAAVKAIFGAAMIGCAVLQLAHVGAAHETPHTAQAAPEWPTAWDGKPLRPLAFGGVEQRFANRFPGSITRMTDGQQVLVLRHVNAPTRMLHPAADCYRGLGYRVESQQLERDRDQQLRRCFIADNGTNRLRVCEQITDSQGQVFTDTSAWYWAATMRQSTGPWRAVTSAQPL